LGWAGEGTLFTLIQSVLGPLVTPATEGVFHGLSFALAFLLMTYAHVVLGEVVPKNLAMEKADQLAVLVAPVLLVFYRVSGPFVFAVERSAGALSRALGLKGESSGGGHSAEELKFIIATSRRQGHLRSFEERAIQRLLDLQDYLVREIMVPRNEIVSTPVDAGLDEVLAIMNEHKLSRIPVYQGEPEYIVGIVHYKDLMAVWHERRSATSQQNAVRRFDLRRLVRKPFVVPETKPVNQLIDGFRAEHSHMALVVDEFGSVVGVVTLEDALEQVFGEIEDEHDVPLPPVVYHSSKLDLEGNINIRDLETQYGIDLPVDAGFETLAGYVLYRLGKIPETGDSVEGEDFRFTVLEMERNRIAKVKVERLEREAPAESGEGAEQAGE